MELSFLMKVRIVAVALIGIILVGVAAWPWDNPPDPYGSILPSAIGTNGIVTLLIMAFLAGLFSYFAAWPYGREIGILAVPFGMCVWALRAGTAGGLFQTNPTAELRIGLLSMFRWETIFWLFVVAVGFAGVTLGERIRKSKRPEQETPKENKDNLSYGKYSNPAVSLLVSAVIVHIGIVFLSKDVILSDRMSGNVVAQPVVTQVVFAVLISFGLAAYAVKILFNAGFFWPVASSIVVTAYSTINYSRGQHLENFYDIWPGIILPDASLSVLPVQMVSFAVIGSVTGYWLGARFKYYRNLGRK